MHSIVAFIIAPFKRKKRPSKSRLRNIYTDLRCKAFVFTTTNLRKNSPEATSIVTNSQILSALSTFSLESVKRQVRLQPNCSILNTVRNYLDLRIFRKCFRQFPDFVISCWLCLFNTVTVYVWVPWLIFHRLNCPRLKRVVHVKAKRGHQ